MESWENGKKLLLEKIENICNQVGANIIDEINNGNSVGTSREELVLLRGNASRVEKLVENNAHLEDELEKCRVVATRVDTLEKENKRLGGELAQVLQRQSRASATPGPQFNSNRSRSPTPRSVDPPPSSTRPGQSRVVAWEKYQSLVLKYNKVRDSHKIHQEAKEELEQRVRLKEEKNKQWAQWAENEQAKFKAKDEKIQKLEVENRKLLAALDETKTRGRKAGSTPQIATQGRSLQVYEDTEVTATTTRPEEVETLDKPESLDSQDEDDLQEHAELPKHRTHIDNGMGDSHSDPHDAQHVSSTEGDSSPMPGGHGTRSSEPSSEMPVVLYSQVVKKRTSNHGATSANHLSLSKVKPELLESSPIALVAINSLNQDASMDLDDIGEKVNTPRRKRTRPPKLSQRALSSASQPPPTSENLSQHQSLEDSPYTSAPEEALTRRKDSALQPRSTNQQVFPRTSDGRAKKRRRMASDKAVGSLAEDGEFEAPPIDSLQASDIATSRLGQLLSKPSPTKQVLRLPQSARVNTLQTPRAKLSATSSLAFGTSGSPNRSQENRNTTYGRSESSILLPIPHTAIKSSNKNPTTVPGSSRPSSRGRSHAATERPRQINSPVRGSADLLLPKNGLGPSRPASRAQAMKSIELPTPSSRTSLSVSPGRPSRKAAGPATPAAGTTSLRGDEDIGGLTVPPRRDLEAIFSRPRARPTVATPKTVPCPAVDKPSITKRRQTVAGSEALDVGPEDEPLRLQPVKNLTLQDFKINENYNQGYNYAFSETVRGEARKCLQSCTKPECCGHKFRALAQMTYDTGMPPTMSQEEADEMLLDEFLGDNKHKKKNMGKDERTELLLQARTRMMANKFGRHRQAYERRTSPPGFWRADFPTTQEDREDREKAAQMGREEVQKRYEQAMRPGGAYKFRDE